MTVELRFDDECNNRHNTFSVTGEIRVPIAGVVSCSMLHDMIRD